MRCEHGYCYEGFKRRCCPPPPIPVGTIVGVVGALLLVGLVILLICCYRKRPDMFNKCLKSYQSTYRQEPTRTVQVTVQRTTVTTHGADQPYIYQENMVYYPTTIPNTAYTTVSTGLPANNTGNQYPQNVDPQTMSKYPPQEVNLTPNAPAPANPPPSYEEAQRLI